MHESHTTGRTAWNCGISHAFLHAEATYPLPSWFGQEHGLQGENPDFPPPVASQIDSMKEFAELRKTAGDKPYTASMMAPQE